MKMELRIFKNTVVMIIQPLILNLISLSVIGYTARKLGIQDFGTFNLALLFSTLFYPLGVMGLNSVFVRDVSRVRENKETSEAYIGRLLGLRWCIIGVAVIMVILAALIMHYPPKVFKAICVAALILGAQLLSESICDVFSAHERMEYTAFVGFISGLTLTVLSVVVLYLGMGVLAVLFVYALGQILGVALSMLILKKRFVRLRLAIDYLFWKKKLLEGLPFVGMSLIWAGMLRFDTIILSKAVSAIDLGLYTTGMMLITKINLIPEAAGSSLYPAISNLHANKRDDDIRYVIQKTLSSILTIALPISIGTCFYGKEIIRLIFGSSYERAGWILSVAIWALVMRCYQFVEFSALAATNKHQTTLRAYIVAGLSCLVLNLLLTLPFKMGGALASFLGAQLVLTVLFTVATVREHPGCVSLSGMKRMLTLNVCLVMLLVLLKPFSFPIVLVVSGLFYVCGILGFGIISVSQLKQFKQAYRR
ncbi:MAG TPA: flippase [Syntrophorhabdaceae bacterium]|nr:flippase [Syntrophorhabdaceae bacterium]